MKTQKYLSIGIAACIMLGGALNAQIKIDDKLKKGTYTQDFDSLPMYGTQAWKNNESIPGWFSTEESITAGYGGQKVTPEPGVYSLGDEQNPSDRALGATPSIRKRVSVGLRMLNDTKNTIKEMDIAYTVRQFRGGDPSNEIKVWFKVGAPGEASLSDGSGWKALSDLDYKNKHVETAPLRPVASYKVAGTAKKMNLKPGQEILIRWTFVKKEATGFSAGIDNISIKNFK